MVDGRRGSHRRGAVVPELVSDHDPLCVAGGWHCAEDDGTVTPRSRRSEAGQTFTETAMILGIITAIIIGLTGIIVPSFSTAIAGLVRHMLVFVGSTD
jgi:hypothetical protein